MQNEIIEVIFLQENGHFHRNFGDICMQGPTSTGRETQKRCRHGANGKNFSVFKAVKYISFTGIFSS
jgi:hypothetical protein